MRVAVLLVAVLAIGVAGWVGVRATQPEKHCVKHTSYYGVTTTTCR